MLNPFTGIRFLIIEETDIGETVIEEYDADSNGLEQMRRDLEQHVQELKQGNPDKNYILKEDSGDSDEAQQVLS